MSATITSNNLNTLKESANAATTLMKVLANADRLMLLCQLSQGERSVSELEALTGIQQPTLSQQLSVLREHAIVKTRRDGKSIFYRVASKPALAIIDVLAKQLCKID